MIENPDWKNIIASAADISTVCEFYSPDAVPGDDGFDPNDAIACYAAVSDITYMGVEYTRLITSFGGVKRSLTKQANTTSVTFSNVNRVISRYELNNGFEGLVMVIRTISRSLSDSLDKSQILFAGRCDKPTGGSKESMQVSATWVLGGPNLQIPYRKYSRDDQEGRVSSDPEFEGFIFMAQEGSVSYSVREGRRKYILFGPRKTTWKTMPWSSYSNIDADKAVPEVLGRSQLEGTHIGFADVGSNIQLRTAFAQGPIYDIVDYARSLDTRLVINTAAYAKLMGLVGTLNGPDDPTWIAPGYYSRTAHIRTEADNSLVDETDPAPAVVATIMGRLMTIPDGSGDWTNDDQWSNNGAAHVRWLLTSPDYYNLDPSWIEDEDFTETYNYNDELVLLKTASDLVLLVEG